MNSNFKLVDDIVKQKQFSIYKIYETLKVMKHYDILFSY